MNDDGGSAERRELEALRTNMLQSHLAGLLSQLETLDQETASAAALHRTRAAAVQRNRNEFQSLRTLANADLNAKTEADLTQDLADLRELSKTIMADWESISTAQSNPEEIPAIADINQSFRDVVAIIDRVTGAFAYKKLELQAQAIEQRNANMLDQLYRASTTASSLSAEEMGSEITRWDNLTLSVANESEAFTNEWEAFIASVDPKHIPENIYITAKKWIDESVNSFAEVCAALIATSREFTELQKPLLAKNSLNDLIGELDIAIFSLAGPPGEPGPPVLSEEAIVDAKAVCDAMPEKIQEVLSTHGAIATSPEHFELLTTLYKRLGDAEDLLHQAGAMQNHAGYAAKMEHDKIALLAIKATALQMYLSEEIRKCTRGQSDPDANPEPDGLKPANRVEAELRKRLAPVATLVERLQDELCRRASTQDHAISFKKALLDTVLEAWPMSEWLRNAATHTLRALELPSGQRGLGASPSVEEIAHRLADVLVEKALIAIIDDKALTKNMARMEAASKVRDNFIAGGKDGQLDRIRETFQQDIQAQLIDDPVVSSLKIKSMAANMDAAISCQIDRMIAPPLKLTAVKQFSDPRSSSHRTAILSAMAKLISGAATPEEVLDEMRPAGLAQNGEKLFQEGPEQIEKSGQRFLGMVIAFQSDEQGNSSRMFVEQFNAGESLSLLHKIPTSEMNCVIVKDGVETAYEPQIGQVFQFKFPKLFEDLDMDDLENLCAVESAGVFVTGRPDNNLSGVVVGVSEKGVDLDDEFISPNRLSDDSILDRRPTRKVKKETQDAQEQDTGATILVELPASLQTNVKIVRLVKLTQQEHGLSNIEVGQQVQLQLNVQRGSNNRGNSPDDSSKRGKGKAGH